MNRAKPRRAWDDGVSGALHSACKSMHLMHASLFTNRAGQKKGVERTKSGNKKAADFSGRCGQWRVRKAEPYRPIVWRPFTGSGVTAGAGSGCGGAVMTLVMLSLVLNVQEQSRLVHW